MVDEVGNDVTLKRQSGTNRCFRVEECVVHSRDGVPASVSVEVTRACEDVNGFFNASSEPSRLQTYLNIL